MPCEQKSTLEARRAGISAGQSLKLHLVATVSGMVVENIETARLRLRSVRPTDADALYEVFREPEVSRFMSSKPANIERMRTAVERMLEPDYPAGLGVWAWEDRANGAVIGRGHLWPCVATGDQRAEIGWFLARSRWGLGLAHEASRAVLQYGFTVLDLPEVIALVHRDNAASLSLAARLGFSVEGSGDYYGGPHLVLNAQRSRFLAGQAPSP